MELAEGILREEICDDGVDGTFPIDCDFRFGDNVFSRISGSIELF
jgi:hypothetical protein